MDSKVNLCKLRIFFVYALLILIQWFMVLVDIDRYPSSCLSSRYWQMNNLSTLCKTIHVTMIVITRTRFYILIGWRVDYIDTKNILRCTCTHIWIRVCFSNLFLYFNIYINTDSIDSIWYLDDCHCRETSIQVAPKNDNLT